MFYKRFLLFLITAGFLMGCSLTAVSKDQIGSTLSIESLKYLPEEVSETSGLAVFGGYLWTINDSGGKDSVYAFDSQHYLFKKRIKIGGAKNIDWESLAQNKNHLFIADCGNNQGKRKQLDIYKVSWNKLLKAKDGEKVASKKISFHYVDQVEHETGRLNNYDCEALTVVGKKLWLFTKNRGDLQSRLYLLDTEQSKQDIEPIISLPVSGLITAADYNEKTGRLVLLGYQKASPFGKSFIWVLKVVEGLPVWESATYHTILPYGQWEAVIWKDDKSLLLTSEKSPLGTQQVGLIQLSD